jgi:hypothetical protein
MHEASRSEADLAMKSYAAFHFALKAISTGIDRAFSDAEMRKIWQVVRDVAAGRLTLTISPAEIQASDPTILPTMKHHIQETMQANIQAERELAAMLVRAAEGFVVRENPNE